jgi:hypothetical protein
LDGTAFEGQHGDIMVDVMVRVPVNMFEKSSTMIL